MALQSKSYEGLEVVRISSQFRLSKLQVRGVFLVGYQGEGYISRSRPFAFEDMLVE